MKSSIPSPLTKPDIPSLAQLPNLPTSPKVARTFAPPPDPPTKSPHIVHYTHSPYFSLRLRPFENH
ncbi:hypothetical protein CROQUDRAFT_652869 [Cronartium quercuum f. sp. fusiforme G11]|uniref:Uncharacterized protein n=1 Tax=Cronartium quercuum f. sp. fusiforme G11 TaxID=708437 RepID=A0A9P6NTA8_9BASI|nr:hypothetical protein CROQUDRAFT_652869 [Cronartium quercuum f. sp. fusiforme G11]